ncbi:MAG TPA: ATP-binding protein [Bryobacteraceae bacterium]|nr:ATP-binding protein [Bryobacteraceae bacterium]
MAASFQGFRSLIENSPDAISLIDTQGEILYGSASTTKIFGYQPEDLVGRNCLELIHPDDRDYSSRLLREVVAKPPGPLKWDARVRHKDGKYCWVESTLSNQLLEAEVKAIVMQQRDIQARREAEAERQKQSEALVRSNLRLEEFAYTAAHDLREPLRAVSLYTEMLVLNTPMDANATRLAKFIAEGAARMSTLIDDLLTFASTGKHEPLRNVDLGDAVTQATENLGLAIQSSGAEVTIDRLPVVRGREIPLVRLFQNLISNAVKYGGPDPIRIHVSAQQHGAEWVIRIADNGIGIAKEHQERVFLPFVRLVNRDIPGTGLGLSVCMKIVEGLGGRMWVESESGGGSAFSFTIPAEGNVVSMDCRVEAVAGGR